MAKYAYHRLDANHVLIREALRAAGATVNEKGPLDLLVGFRGRNYLLEVKTARGKLRASQSAFVTAWKGQSAVVRSVEDAFRVVGVEARCDNVVASGLIEKIDKSMKFSGRRDARC